jgi:multiple sugar transport system substrate-binding protein
MRRWCLGVILAVTWAACSSSNNSNDQTSSVDGGSSVTNPPPISNKPVTIAFLEHNNPAYGQANAAAFDTYRATHPNVTIKVTTVDYASLTATLLADLKNDRLTADLLQVPGNWVCSFTANLTDVPASVITLDMAKTTFFTPQVEGTTCQGVFKALPIEYNLEYGGAVLNLDKYTARFPGKTPAWSDWKSFLADAAGLAEFDPAGMPRANGLDIDPNWPGAIVYIFLAAIRQRGADYWTANKDAFDLTTPAAHDAFNDIVSWIVTDKVMSLSVIPNDPATFVATRLAQGATGYGWNDPTRPLSNMGYFGSWGLAAVQGQLPPALKNTRFDYVALPPMVGTQHKFVTYGGWSFAVPKTSKNQTVAWDIARSIALDPAMMKQWQAITDSLPALRVNGSPDAAATNPLLAKVQPLLEVGEYIGHMPAPAIQIMEGAIQSNVFAVVRGTKNADQALADMQKMTNDALAQNK